jgi:hypothetical protein
MRFSLRDLTRTLGSRPISGNPPPCLLRGNPQGGEFSSHNCSSGEAACLNRLSVIHLGQWTPRNVPPVVPCCSERWREMRQHEVLRPHPLCHRAKISRHALAIKGGRRESAALIRAQDGVHRRVHNDISPLCQLLHLIGCRMRTRQCGHIVAGIAPDHNASGRGVHAIGCMARNMGRPNRQNFHVAR